MQKNMIERIADTMNVLHFPCEWRIQWFQREQKVEIFFMFEVDLKSHCMIQDKYHTVNSSDQFVFEDAVLFYHPHLAYSKDDNYLTTLAFDSMNGLSGGMIDSICKTLRLIVGEAVVELEEFLENERYDHFQIEWNEQNFLSILKTFKETGRFDTTIYSYPTEVSEGVVEK